jgi:hypothetical protein
MQCVVVLSPTLGRAVELLFVGVEMAEGKSI